MKGLIATLGVLSLLATVPATAESFSGEKGFAPLFPAASVDDQTSDNRINIIKRMRDDGLPKRRFSPQGTFVAEDVPKQRTRSPYARPHLFEDVQFRSDGNLGDRIADQYDGFGRSLSARMLGEKRGENVRFKRVDDGVGISIDFD